MNKIQKVKLKIIKLIPFINKSADPLSIEFRLATADQTKKYIISDFSMDNVHQKNSDLLPAITTKEPNGNDFNFYRHKKIDLPRDKFALLKDKFNWSITRDPSKADYQIISDKLIDNLFEYSYYADRFFSREQYISLMDRALKLKIIDISSHNNMKSHLEDDPYLMYRVEAYMYLDQTYPRKVRDLLDEFQKMCEKDQPTVQFTTDGTLYYKHTIKHIKDEVTFDQLQDTSVEYVYDSYLVKLCNADAPVLSCNDYEMIHNLLESNDVSNVDMGLNVLANCNIEKSLHLVSYFYVFYWGSMKESSIWNSINVKSMKNALGEIESIAGRSSRNSYVYDVLINFLIRKNSLDKFIFEKIVQRIFDQYTKHFFNEKTVFKIPEIELKDDWKDFVKEGTRKSILLAPTEMSVVKTIKEADLPF